MKRTTHIVAALLVATLLPAGLLAQAPRITPPGLRQIATLVADKASWSPAQRKLGSHLVLEIKRQRRDRMLEALPGLRSSLDVRDGSVLVDLRGEISEPLLVTIEQLGGKLVSAHPAFDEARAWMPLARLESLAELPQVRSVRPADQMMNYGTAPSEGDVAHRADLARSLFGVDGSGVQVGVLSDGVDSLAALQTSGELPATVTVLPGQAGSGSEGTAMMEIVYDLAPGAELLFATSQGGEAQFAQNILDLQAAGADVIVDDGFYPSEGVFQDDVVADAVNQVTANGVLFFSAAGNSGNLNDGTSGVWEGDFSSAAVDPAALTGQDTHDFGGGVALNVITVDPPSKITLHWSDPLVGSANDYDLFLLDATGSTILGASAGVQDGDDDPYEVISSDDSQGFDDTGMTLAITKFFGAPRFLHLNTLGGQLALATAGQTAGHSSADRAFSVAAVDVATATGGAFTGGPANPVETFSSDGPRLVFFDAAGNPLTPGDLSSTGGELRQKPDLSAADGVSTATPSFDRFYGTSAAAAHAAAIAALLHETGNLTPDGAAQVFAAIALDIEAVGRDRDSGVGILDAVAAVGTTIAPTVPSSCYVDDLQLSGDPNDGPQTFRACHSLTAGGGSFDEVTLAAFDGSPGQVILTDDFASSGLVVRISASP